MSIVSTSGSRIVDKLDLKTTKLKLESKPHKPSSKLNYIVVSQTGFKKINAGACVKLCIPEKRQKVREPLYISLIFL